MSDRRSERQSGRMTVESVGERQREREQEKGPRGRGERPSRSRTRSFAQRKSEACGREEQAIERIGPVRHEGVAGEHAGAKRRETKRNRHERGTKAASLAARRGKGCGGLAARGGIIGPRGQDWPLESGKENRRQRQDQSDINRQLQDERRGRDHRLQRHDDHEVKEIDGVRDAAEIEARASDETAAEGVVRLLEDADADHAERRRDVRKRPLRQ